MHNHDRLALVDLIGARLLSACHTVGDMVGTPDEVIHLAAAMQFCGFRSVVGTLWAMEDVMGVMLLRILSAYVSYTRSYTELQRFSGGA